MMRPNTKLYLVEMVHGKRVESADALRERKEWCDVDYIRLLKMIPSGGKNVHDSCWHRLSVWWMVVIAFWTIVRWFFSLAPSLGISLSWMIQQIWGHQKHHIKWLHNKCSHSAIILLRRVFVVAGKKTARFCRIFQWSEFVVKLMRINNDAKNENVKPAILIR